MTKKIVLKVGGSLSYGDHLPQLSQMIHQLSAENLICIIPGGGAYANLVRQDYLKYHLDEKIAHYMAIMAMDQYGLLLHHLIQDSIIIDDPSLLPVKYRTGVFIWTPFAYFKAHDTLPYSWQVTSDSIAAYAVSLMQAELFVLLKDQNGICSADPKGAVDCQLLSTVARKDLQQHQIVDPFFIKYLPEKVKCWIINGNHPERLKELLIQGRTLGTRII
ncbi:MAG: hypothetical protein M1609_09470 [Firmicutes bacterium]|nr:hypothetical protein [Bacillota bacterium]